MLKITNLLTEKWYVVVKNTIEYKTILQYLIESEKLDSLHLKPRYFPDFQILSTYWIGVWEKPLNGFYNHSFVRGMRNKITFQEFLSLSNNNNSNNKSMNKSLDKNATLLAAAALIIANGSTSTLEVKNSLRNQGYFATQVTVSQFMDELAKEGEFQFQDNGMYRTYTDATNQLATIAKNVVVTKTTTPSGSKIVTATTPQSGDWEVNSTTNKVVHYYSSLLTRDEVRQQYAKQYGVKFVDTRSRKVK